MIKMLNIINHIRHCIKAVCTELPEWLGFSPSKSGFCYSDCCCDYTGNSHWESTVCPLLYYPPYFLPIPLKYISSVIIFRCVTEVLSFHNPLCSYCWMIYRPRFHWDLLLGRKSEGTMKTSNVIFSILRAVEMKITSTPLLPSPTHPHTFLHLGWQQKISDESETAPRHRAGWNLIYLPL